MPKNQPRVVALKELLREVVPKQPPRVVTPRDPPKHPPRAVIPKRLPRVAPAKHHLPKMAIPKRLPRVAPAKHHLPKMAMPKRPPRVVAPMQQVRTWRRPQEYLSRPIRTSPKRYSGPVLTGICPRSMTFTLRFHPPEAGSGASVATLFFWVRGMRMNCRWIFPSAPITDRKSA